LKAKNFRNGMDGGDPQSRVVQRGQQAAVAEDDNWGAGGDDDLLPD
jgi:hypothetical protein